MDQTLCFSCPAEPCAYTERHVHIKLSSKPNLFMLGGWLCGTCGQRNRGRRQGLSACTALHTARDEDDVVK